MSEFIWILPRHSAASLGELGVSRSYILPRSNVIVRGTELFNSLLWVVLRGEDDRLVLVLQVKELNSILEGYLKDDFLIEPDLQKSLRVGSLFKDLNSFATYKLRMIPEGISELPPSASTELHLLLRKGGAVLLKTPYRKLLTNFADGPQPTQPEVLAQMVTQLVVSSSNLVDIWADGRIKKFRKSPFGSVARGYIEEKFPKVNLSEIDDYLIRSDPFSWIIGSREEGTTRQAPPRTSKSAPFIDILFNAVDPNKIFARKYADTDYSSHDYMYSMKKTEAAEQKHQDILRDVSAYLRSNRIQPFQSKSIDLAYSLNGALQVFEIKSANQENALSQAAKGVFQLACYKNTLTSNYDSIVCSLLLEDTGSPNLNIFVMETLQSLGIYTYFYYSGLPWPNRIPNLPVR